MILDERFNERGFAIVACNVRVYNWDAYTLEYKGSTDEFLHPGIGIPAHSCLDAPPDPIDGYAICRAVENNSWIQVFDYRGKLAYNKNTGQEVEIDVLGPLPEQYTFNKPEGIYSTWDESTQSWNNDPRPYYSRIAKDEKTQILAYVAQVTANWQSQLMLGIITDDARDSLITWQHFAQQVEAISTDVTDRVEWPTPPEIK